MLGSASPREYAIADQTSAFTTDNDKDLAHDLNLLLLH